MTEIGERPDHDHGGGIERVLTQGEPPAAAATR
jgi:hypothetical protein